MKNKIILLIAILLNNISFSQTQEDILEKQKLVFKSVSLDSLLCIDSINTTFGRHEIDSDHNFDRKTKLTEENVKIMFLGNSDSVEIRNYWTDEVLEMQTAENYLSLRTFYLQNVVLTNKKWTAIIIEVIYNDISDKYIVTIDKKQNLISKYRIAFYGIFGSYTCCEEDENGNIIQEEFEDEEGNLVMRDICGRCPYYTGQSACIDKDLIIRLKGDITPKAFIDKKGNIIESKDGTKKSLDANALSPISNRVDTKTRIDSIIYFEESLFKTVELDTLRITKVDFEKYKNAYKISCTIDSSGFISGYGLSVSGDCDEICEDYLIEKNSGDKISLPTSYDQGIFGLLFSPSCNQFIVYSSSDGSDNYYSDRAEIYWFRITKEKGLEAIKPSFNYSSKEWSIEEIIWINDKSIALKVYEEGRWGDGSGVNFKYYKAEINK